VNLESIDSNSYQRHYYSNASTGYQSVKQHFEIFHFDIL